MVKQQTHVISGKTKAQVVDGLRLLCSPEGESLLRRGLLRRHPAARAATDLCLNTETCCALDALRVERLELVSVREWSDYPLLLRVLRLLQNWLRPDGYLQKPPRWYDVLLGVRRAVAPAFYQDLMKLLLAYGMDDAASFHFMLELESTIFPLHPSHICRALRSPLRGEVMVVYDCHLYDR